MKKFKDYNLEEITIYVGMWYIEVYYGEKLLQIFEDQEMKRLFKNKY